MLLLVVLTLGLVLVPAVPAAADLVFDFSWQSSIDYWTAIPVNRVNPDGSVTPYDQVRLDGTLAGTGTLTLGPSTAGFTAGGHVFAFDGTAGGGGGAAYPDGHIDADPRFIQFPIPSIPTPPVPAPDPFFFSPTNGGLLTLDGDPADPSGISISFFSGSSPHCTFGGCETVSFLGEGTRTVSTAEPAPLVLVAAALGSILVLHRRQCRRPIGRS